MQIDTDAAAAGAAAATAAASAAASASCIYYEVLEGRFAPPQKFVIKYMQQKQQLQQQQLQQQLQQQQHLCQFSFDPSDICTKYFRH